MSFKEQSKITLQVKLRIGQVMFSDGENFSVDAVFRIQKKNSADLADE
jgi:hypothetical protein